MHFVVIGKDKGVGERARHRAAHLEFIAARQEPVITQGR